MNAHKIITLANYSEKQQGLVDAMLVTWNDIEGYNETYAAISKLTEEQQNEVAQAIIDRRNDKVSE